MTHLCIKPACGSTCSMCSHAISAETVHAYAIRYAVLRAAPIDAIHAGGVFAGQTPQNVVLNGDDLDAAIDAIRGVVSSRLHPEDHWAKDAATGIDRACATTNNLFPPLSEPFLKEEPELESGSIDAPDYIAAGSCVNEQCPFAYGDCVTLQSKTPRYREPYPEAEQA